MTPLPRAARSLDEALGQALEDLEAGLTPPQILDRYPEFEADLASLIETAYRLCTTRWPVLSMAARVQGRERMQAALTAQKARHRFAFPPIWRPLGAGLALVVLAGMTYLASPFSPLRPPVLAPLPSATPLIAATASWTPEPSATWWPSPTNAAVVTALASPTRLIRSIPEPTETIQRFKDATDTPEATATVTPQVRASQTAAPTHTRVPTAVATALPSASPSPSATNAPTQVPGDSKPATPAPTVAVPAADGGWANDRGADRYTHAASDGVAHQHSAAGDTGANQGHAYSDQVAHRRARAYRFADACTTLTGPCATLAGPNGDKAAEATCYIYPIHRNPDRHAHDLWVVQSESGTAGDPEAEEDPRTGGVSEPPASLRGNRPTPNAETRNAMKGWLRSEIPQLKKSRP